MKRKFIKLPLVILSVILIASFSFAAEKGSLKVRALAVPGSVIPGVSVVISSPIMMGTQTKITDDNGEALFLNLTPGVYKVKAEMEGFKTVISEKVRVSLDVETTIPVNMELAQIKETITVTAEAAVIDTKKSVIADHVNQDTVQALPIARDFVGYLQLAAGVNIVPNSGGRDTPEDPAGKGGLNYRDRGLQGVATGGKRGSRDNMYFLDGMNITGMSTQTALTTFNNEVIQEQELMTSGVPAEYGGGKGIVGNVVTKSGGNKLSGSVNFYLQSKSFYLDYAGADYESASDPTMLEGYADNKYDTAFTLGGPIMKDKLWFFGSLQYRNDDNTFELSQSASPTRDEVAFTEKRLGMFGKISFKLSSKDSVSFMYFSDDYDTAGSRDQNTIESRHPSYERQYGVYSLYYQRVLSENMFFDFRYGHYWFEDLLGPKSIGAGVRDSFYASPGLIVPIYQREFGGYHLERDNMNKRDQFQANLEWFAGNMKIKAGFMYSDEKDSDNQFYANGADRTSIHSSLFGKNLGELTSLDVFPKSEMDERLIPYLNDNWGPTSTYFDANHDHHITAEELSGATFNADNEYGGKLFWRIMTAKKGQNEVNAKRMIAYIMDDWKVSDEFSINAGFRFEKHDYSDSQGITIINMDWALLPRIGLVWDIGGNGTKKITAFYGHFSDPINMSMVHFGGNISGSITHEQMWLNDAWYTYRIRGSAERRDCSWVPNTKDSLAKEFSLTYEADLGDGMVFAVQGYMRQDRRIIEDYDLFTYLDHYDGHETWGGLDLEPQDFGYGSVAEIGEANYYLGNLIGGKRDIYGLDVELSKRFKNGSFLVAQYSYKYAEGNSQSDGNADLQGDLIEIDPRNPWMLGPTPGTIPRKLKLYGTYRTKFGLDIGALFYWMSGVVYTESYDFMPGRYSIYINWPLNEGWTDFVQTGQQKTSPYWQFDMKFNYGFKLSETIVLDLFLDIYNVFNNQASIELQYARNDPTWGYQGITEILLPLRFYLGARLRF